MASNWRWLIIHHSESDDGPGNNWDAIRAYHMSWRHNFHVISEAEGKALQAAGTLGVEPPFQDIAYHWGVERVGDVYVVKAGRSMDMPGAHAGPAWNGKAIGICLVGNFDKAAPPDAQLSMTASLCDVLMRKFDIPPEHVIGHREAQAMEGLGESQRKTCPGLKLNMDRFRKLLGSNAPRLG